VLDRWASRVVDLARQVRPAMVRCYGIDVNAYAALRIKETLGVPYVASVHTARDESPEPRSAPQQIMDRLWQRVERRIVAGAERVLPVYRAIVPQLLRLGAPRVEVAYNVLNPEHLGRKTDYRLHAPVRVLTVGRQLAHKRPDALLRAVARLPQCHLTVVGDGPAHAELRVLAASLGLGGRVTFTASIANDELCASLPEFDIFAGHSDYCEIPKAVLEPLLTGLPVIMNRRAGAPVPEYSEDFMMLVDNDERGYYTALTALIEDGARREALGQRAYAHAQAHWGPAAAEAHIVRVYREIIGATA
jgi:glycosyltransferase involved in cell wall biosynthesis